METGGPNVASLRVIGHDGFQEEGLNDMLHGTAE